MITPVFLKIFWLFLKLKLNLNLQLNLTLQLEKDGIGIPEPHFLIEKRWDWDSKTTFF